MVEMAVCWLCWWWFGSCGCGCCGLCWRWFGFFFFLAVACGCHIEVVASGVVVEVDVAG